MIGATGGAGSPQFAEQLVSTERSGQDKINKTHMDKIKADSDAYHTLDRSFKKVNSALTHFKSEKFDNKTVTINDKNADVSVEDNAPLGRFDLKIKQLATSSELTKVFTSEKAELPKNGILKLDIGDKSLSINLSDFQKTGKPYTLENLRDTINISKSNPGIQASLVRTGSGVNLLLTSLKTGEKQQIKVSFNNKDWGMNELIKAQDAKINLNGIDITNPSNQLTNVIDGVNIGLKKTHKKDESSSIEVKTDTDKNKKEVNKLVGALNTLLDDIKGLTFTAKPDSFETSASKTDKNDKEDKDKKDSKKYSISSSNISKKQVGALKSDSSVRRLRNKISQLAFFKTTTGLRLSDIGIEISRDGAFKVNQKKLDDAFKNKPKDITKILSFKGGMLEQLDKLVKPYAKFDGLIDGKEKDLQEQQKQLQKRMDDFNVQMKQKYQQYLKQFTAMEQTISSLDSAGDIFGQMNYV